MKNKRDFNFEISDEIIKKIENLATRGLKRDDIFYNLDATTKKIEKLSKSCKEEIDFAIRKGRAKGTAAIANRLFEEAMGGDVKAIIFWLKARAGWREVSVTEVVDQTAAVTVSGKPRTAAEAARAYQELIGRD